MENALSITITMNYNARTVQSKNYLNLAPYNHLNVCCQNMLDILVQILDAVCFLYFNITNFCY